MCVFVCVWALALCLSASLFFWRNANLAGDLRVVLVVLCCCFLVVMICRVHATNSCPCTSMNNLFSGKDRASERQGPNSREKKLEPRRFRRRFLISLTYSYKLQDRALERHRPNQRHCSVLFWSLDALFVFGLPLRPPGLLTRQLCGSGCVCRPEFSVIRQRIIQ